MHIGFGIHCILIGLILSERILQAEGACRQRLESVEEGRTCRKPCTSDADCRGSKKRCQCDNVCGMTCFNKESECEDPKPVENGRVKWDSIRYGSKATYYCDDGYVLKGLRKRTCHADKKWGGVAPTCQRGCLLPNVVGKAFPNSLKTDFAPGEEVEYSCLSGRYMEGNPRRTCNPDSGGWSTATYICRLQVCNELPPVANGQITYTEDRIFGSRAELSCDTGYQPDSYDKTVRCHQGESGSPQGRWSDTLTTCSIKTCPAPDTPRDGTVDDHGSLWEYGDRITYACNFGFEMSGEAEHLCNENGTWGVVPSCIVRPNCNFNDFNKPTCGYRNPEGRWRLSSRPPGMAARTDRGGSRLISPSIPDDWAQGSICVKFDFKLEGGGISVTHSEPSSDSTFWTSHENEETGKWLNVAVTIRSTSRFQYQIVARDGLVYLDNIQVDRKACTDYCLPSPCRNGGTCVNRIRGFSCFCTIDYEGTRCENDRKCTRPYTRIPNGILASILPNLLLPGTTVRYECNENYKFTGIPGVVTTKTIRCERDFGNSKWVPRFWDQRCTDIVCSLILNENVRAKYQQDLWKVGDVVTYQCDAGYEFVGSPETFASCGKDERWSAPSPNCRKVRCPVIQFENMAGTYPWNEYADRVFVRCKDGYTLRGAQTLICQSNREWNQVLPTCQRVPCPTLMIDNSLEDIQGKFGDSVTVECRRGYEISGQAKLVCLWNGRWNHNAPTCEKIRCDVIRIDNMVPISETKYFEDSIEIRCNTGYEVVGDARQTCQWDGSWSPGFPRCEKVKCQAPIDIDHALEVEKNIYEYKDAHRYECKKGYKITGDNNMVCRHTREWSHPPPNCTLITCQEPKIDHGEVGTSGNRSQWLPGTIAYFSCIPGFLLQGSEGAICDDNGAWNTSIPTCSRVPCTTLMTDNSLEDIHGKFGDSVSVECRRGYEISGQANLECLWNGMWNHDKPICEKISCNEIRIDNMVPISETKYFEDSIEIECNTGYEVVGDARQACQWDGSWSPGIPRCKMITCQEPQIDHGVVGTPHNQSQWLPGSIANFSCIPGFSLQGSQEITCEKNGEWNATIPTCSRVQCEEIKISNMTKINDIKYFEENVTIECKPGHQVKGSKVITCQADGSWSPKLPRCTRRRCPNLPNIEHADPVSRENFKYTDEYSYNCVEGYKIAGREVLVCAEDGQWSAEVPNCALITCESLGVDDAIIFTSNNNTQRLPGDVANISCTPGYQITGASELTCQANGTWDHNIPKCSKITCPELEQGEALIIEPEQSEWTPGDKATFSCRVGYNISGQRELFCQNNGNWTGDLPSCSPVTCPPPQKLKNADETPDRVFKYNETYTYKCSEYYRINRIATLECTINGQWSREPPTCDLIECKTPPERDNLTLITRRQPGPWLPNHKATFQCSEGYTLIGSSKLTCKDNGDWSENIPSCVETVCAAPMMDPNLILSPEQATWKPGDEVTFRCSGAYVLDGPSETTCSRQGTWDVGFPRCLASNICHLQSLIEPEGWEVEDSTRTEFNIDETVELSCTGQKVSVTRNTGTFAKPIFVCQSGGIWTRAEPGTDFECVRHIPSVRLGCPPDPESPPNSRWYDARQGRNSAVGDRMYFSCKLGFSSLEESKYLVCQEDGTWSDNAGCEERKATLTTSYDNIDYLFYLDEAHELSYTDAQQFCLSIGANLAVIYSDAVTQALRNAFQRIEALSKDVYIGLTRSTWGSWRWDTTGVASLGVGHSLVTPNLGWYGIGQRCATTSLHCWFDHEYRQRKCQLNLEKVDCGTTRRFLCQRKLPTCPKPQDITITISPEKRAYSQDDRVYILCANYWRKIECRKDGTWNTLSCWT